MGSKVLWRRLFFAGALLLACARQVPADAVFGELFDLRQPDGALVTVRIWGDEFYQVVESLDGYTLVRDPKTQTICYARLSPDGGQLLSTGVAVEPAVPAGLAVPPHLRIRTDARSAQVAAARAAFAAHDRTVQLASGAPTLAAAPRNGNVRALCLIVDFPDSTGTISPVEVDRYCNQAGYTGFGNNGSVHDYFRDVSDGHLNYTNYVPPAYFRASRPKTYYDNPAEACGPKARELILEALNDLESHGFDFSQFDSNGDGVVDGINCFYAGNCASGWAKGLWPHSSSVYFRADGVSTSRYQITNMGSSLRIGTFCHENGHMIGYWPDLYDYDYDSRGVGRFCLMGYGNFASNPVEPCAYMKYISGWSTTTLLTVPQAGLPAPSATNLNYKIPHPTRSNEYFLIENRQRRLRDSQLPDAGLAIWHIDTYGSNNNNQMTSATHYLVTLEQADGNWDLELNRNLGDATDLWRAPDYTAWTPLTAPNSNWWKLDASDRLVTAIGPPAVTMTFSFGFLPKATSIVRTGVNPTSASSVAFTVTFNQNMTGVTRDDFAVFANGVTGASATDVQGGGNTYVVHVDTGTRDGTVRLDLIDHDSILDGIGTPLGGPGSGNGNFARGESYAIDKTPPTVPGTPQDGGAFTSATTIAFTWAAAADAGTSPSGLAAYELQVGTAPGGSDVFAGGIGSAFSAPIDGANGQTLFARVRAWDRAGNAGAWSPDSDGITVDTVPPHVVGGATWNPVTLEVNFDDAVVNADQPRNYAFTPPLALLGVQRISDRSVLLRTAPQDSNTTYTLTVGGVVADRAGNPIDPAFRSLKFRGDLRTAVSRWIHYR